MTVPKVRYLCPSPRGYTPLNGATGRTPLRLTRRETGPGHGPVVNLGQYFECIKDIISKEGYGLLADAAARQLGRDVSVVEIEEILIYAEKHGSDYHPARIEVMIGGVYAVFVMNVAITTRGKAWLCREFEVLQRLNRKHDFPFLPRTYFQGETAYQPGQPEETDASMLMFLADWFQGYHEFHLSIDKEDGSQRLVLWDADKGYYHISWSRALETYSKAAMILTLYYDVGTFEQIFPWHHAAGDFVAKVQEGSLDVRLVTARQYAPMVGRSEGVSAREALLLFLLNLCVRMRLDRLDGDGPLAWADDGCVDATLEGFLEGLRIKQRKGFIDQGFTVGFLDYIGTLAKEDLSYGFHALVDASDQTAPDIPVIRNNLEMHISRFHSALQVMKRS